MDRGRECRPKAVRSVNTTEVKISSDTDRHCSVNNWFVPTDVLFANSDEPNLILPKFARPLYFFLIRPFGTP